MVSSAAHVRVAALTALLEVLVLPSASVGSELLRDGTEPHTPSSSSAYFMVVFSECVGGYRDEDKESFGPDWGKMCICVR